MQDAGQQTVNRTRLSRLLAANDFAGMKELFHAFFAGIPHEWYTNNDIADYEGCYASVFYSCFAALGLDSTDAQSWMNLQDRYELSLAERDDADSLEAIRPLEAA